MIEIVIATKNKHKFDEITKILDIPGTSYLSTNDFSEINEIVEDGKTFEENAVIKAKEINRLTGHIALGDDSGLEIEALDNKPGINSSRFLGENTDYKIKNNKILELMEKKSDLERNARFVCAIAVCFNENDITVVKGICNGKISNKITGESGFGYDPIFLVPQYNKTFAELDEEIKNRISHRAVALKKIKDFLSQRINEKSL